MTGDIQRARKRIAEVEKALDSGLIDYTEFDAIYCHWHEEIQMLEDMAYMDRTARNEALA